MEIGYWIKDGLIYGPGGYTGLRIQNNQIFGRAGYTRLWIHRHQIYSSTAGNTGFWIDNDRIHGPGRELPWMPQRTTRASGTRHIQI